MNNQTIRKEIVRGRKSLGLSQTALARKAGVSLSQVSKIESGAASNPQIVQLRKLLRAVGLDIAFVLAE